MRKAFVDALTAQAERDPSVLLLTGDLGFTVLEPFAERHPHRFFNVGVAEQNMLALATGLASTGFTPFVYSIATFASMRAYEFLRNGAVLHELPVRVVGVGGGYDYGSNGPTHWALEDIALMRTQPGLTVIAPADSAQTASAVAALEESPAPAYLRLAKDASPVPGLDGQFRLGRLELLGDGEDVALISYGNMTAEAVVAARLLEEQGLSATVAVASSLAPAPREDLTALLSRVPLAITLEAHYVGGGVGSLVCEVVAEEGLGCRVLRRGIESISSGVTGSRSYLQELAGLTATDVAAAARAALEVL